MRFSGCLYRLGYSGLSARGRGRTPTEPLLGGLSLTPTNADVV